MEQFENGTKNFNGITPIVDLNGSWREMGRQYGALLFTELKDMYENAICNELFKKRTINSETARIAAEKLYANYPFRFKQFFLGMAETSSLSLEQLQLVNAIEVIAFSADMQPGCTGIAVWGDYAAEGLVYGRNYDYYAWMKDFAKDIVVAAFHPTDGSLATATIGFAGEIYAVNGMNEKGIFLELNNGMPSGGPLWFDNREPSIVKLFEFLLDCETLDDMETMFQTTKSNFAYIIGVTDGQVARCYEWPTFGVKRRESHTRPGLTVLTNHFTEPSWGLPRPEDASFWNTRSRRTNLLALAKHFKGVIDVNIMKDIMDTKLEKLGATYDGTLYQIITEPAKFELWLKVPGVQDWTAFDMKALLRPRED